MYFIIRYPYEQCQFSAKSSILLPIALFVTIIVNIQFTGWAVPSNICVYIVLDDFIIRLHFTILCIQLATN